MRGAALVVVALGLAAGCPSPAPIEPRRPLFTGGDPAPAGGAIATSGGPAAAEPTPGAGARTLGDGVVVEITTPGTGEPPRPNDRVTLRTRGWDPAADADGADAMADLPEHTLEARRLPFGLAQAVGVMRVGGRARAWVPAVHARGGEASPIIVDLELRAVQVAPLVPADVAAPPASATRLAPGISTVVLAPGTGGPKPGSTDEVVVIYSSWQADGTMLETTTWDYQPTRTWTVSRFSAGVAAGLAEMTAGEKRRLWIPIHLTEYADGSAPQPDEPRVVYDVELVELHVRAPVPPVPRDLKRPPANAKRTPRGVRYKVLARGKTTDHPGPTSRVKVHYTGWSTDGRVIDSSHQRGTPGVFGLDQVIAGWTDVLQHMTPGERVRAWIPSALAYGDQPGRPQGMLVFDMELLEILR